MLSCVYAYVQSHQNAYIKHMHLFVYVHHSKVEKNQKVYRFLKQLSILIEKEIKFWQILKLLVTCSLPLIIQYNYLQKRIAFFTFFPKLLHCAIHCHQGTGNFWKERPTLKPYQMLPVTSLKKLWFWQQFSWRFSSFSGTCCILESFILSDCLLHFPRLWHWINLFCTLLFWSELFFSHTKVTSSMKDNF